MDLYLTFFAERNGGRCLNVANGFSFGREKQSCDVDLFVQQGCDSASVARRIEDYPNADRILCSLSYSSQLKTVMPILDERWVLGGPLVANLPEFFEQRLCKTYLGSFESYLGKSELSSAFDTYFAKFTRIARPPHIFFNCAIGEGCYWGRCKFCGYRCCGSAENGRVTLRPDIAGIIEQLHPIDGCAKMSAHLGISATPPKALSEILDARRDRRVGIIAFLRADKAVLDVLNDRTEPTSCQNILFSIGCETLSQTALDRLDKGTTIDDTIELVRLIMEREGKVALGIMDHYVFADDRMVRETRDAIAKLRAVIKNKRLDRVSFTNNGVTLWPSREAVEEFTSDYSLTDCFTRDHFVANVPKNSDAFRCNQEIAVILRNSGIDVRGAKFVSLENHR